MLVGKLARRLGRQTVMTQLTTGGIQAVLIASVYSDYSAKISSWCRSANDRQAFEQLGSYAHLRQGLAEHDDLGTDL
jgi:hypothetical protein